MPAGRNFTFPLVVELLKEEVNKRGQRAVARDTTISLPSIQRYLKGGSEPSQASLQKLADYFGVSVAYLRGETVSNSEHVTDYLDEIWGRAYRLNEKYGPDSEFERIKYLVKELYGVITSTWRHESDGLLETEHFKPWGEQNNNSELLQDVKKPTV